MTVIQSRYLGALPQIHLEGPQTLLAGAQTILAGPQTHLVGPHTPPAGPKTPLIDDGMMDGWMDRRNFSPFYRTASPV